MKAAEIRRRILEEHAELRSRLDEIEELAKQFEKGAADIGGRLRERGLALYDRFAEHIGHEDELLAPALRAAGASGPGRAARLGHEHQEQRELLAYLVGRLRDQSRPTTLMARELQNFVGYLRYDMAHEEETMLSEEILGDASSSDSD